MKRCSSRSWYATAAVFIAFLVFSSIGGPAGAAARYLATILLPGITVLFLVFGERMGVGEACLFGGALSPLILTLVAIWCIGGGHGFASVPTMLNIVFLLLLVVGLLMRGSSERRESIPTRAWLAALMLAALIVVPLVMNPALRIRSDAWFHASVAESIGRGGLPPDDPYYAGIQLRYFWAYHGYLLMLRSAVPGSLFDHMATINVAFFPIYLMLLFTISSRISEKRSGPFWSMLLAVFGVNVIGSMLLAGRVAFGDTRGLSLLGDIIDGGSYGVLNNLGFRYTGSISFFLDKFLVGSPFAMTLAMFIGALHFLVGWLASGSRREAVFACLFAASSILFHTIVGFSLLLCGAGALAAVFVRAIRARDAMTTRRASTGLALLGAAGLLCIPYLRTILAPPGPGAGTFTVNGAFLWTILAAGILPLILLALRAKRQGIRGTGPVFMLFFAAFALLLGTFARMPFGNINKIVYIVLLPLIVLAGDGAAQAVSLLRRSPRPGAAVGAVVAACGLATVALGLAGYMRDPGDDVPVPLKNGEIALTAAARDAYLWMREETPPHAIFINDSRLDIPVMASRSQIWSPGNYAVTWGYPDEEIGWRRGVVESVYTRGGLPDEARNRLLAAGSPVYIVMRGEELSRFGSTGDLPEALGVREVFRNEEFIIGELAQPSPDTHVQQPSR